MDYRMREAIGKAHGFARLDEDGQTAAVEAAGLAQARYEAGRALDNYMYLLDDLAQYLCCKDDECDADECGGGGAWNEYTKRKPLEEFVREARLLHKRVEFDTDDMVGVGECAVVYGVWG